MVIIFFILATIKNFDNLFIMFLTKIIILLTQKIFVINFIMINFLEFSILNLIINKYPIYFIGLILIN